MKKVLLSFAMLLVAGAGFAQCCKSAYEVKAENAYTNYNVRYASNPMDAKHYTTTAPLKLTSIAPLYTDKPNDQKNLLDNRELGIINIGGEGTVTVDGKKYTLGFQEALYVGRGAKNIEVASKDANKPAKFYMNIACAHQTFPTKKVTLKDANNIKAGSLKESNDRVIHQLIIDGVAGVRTCQLQMGVTELKEGSVWNTMPAHTHLRRMETYLYYNVPEGQKILHVMGEPQETRPIWLNNEQAVIAPEWSIHCAAGTSNYTFIWGMAGENLIYNDMQVVKIPEMKEYENNPLVGIICPQEIFRSHLNANFKQTL